MAIVKLIRCTVAPEHRAAFHQAQQAWRQTAACEGFLGQLGGWSDGDEAWIFALWRRQADLDCFMAGVHDIIVAGNRQQITYRHCRVTLLRSDQAATVNGLLSAMNCPSSALRVKAGAPGSPQRAPYWASDAGDELVVIDTPGQDHAGAAVDGGHHISLVPEWTVLPAVIIEGKTMFLTGEQVYYRPLAVDDAAVFYRWSCDREVVRYSLSSFVHPKSPAEWQQWLASVNQGAKSFSLGVCCKETDALIGYAGIAGISSLNRSGEYFVLIGDKNYWGRGIGTEVTRTVTDYGFDALGLHRIELTAFATNPGAVKAYERAGYRHEGILRQAGFRDGRFHDKVMMAVLASEWPAGEPTDV